LWYAVKARDMELSWAVMAAWSASSTSSPCEDHWERDGWLGTDCLFTTARDILGSTISISHPSSTVEARLDTNSSPASRTVSAARIRSLLESELEEGRLNVSIVLERSRKKPSTLVLAASLTIELSKSRTFSLKLRSKLSSDLSLPM